MRCNYIRLNSLTDAIWRNKTVDVRIIIVLSLIGNGNAGVQFDNTNEIISEMNCNFNLLRLAIENQRIF